MIALTGTRHAPWYVVPADDKRHARLLVLRASATRWRRAPPNDRWRLPWSRAREALPLDEDMPPLVGALQARGARVHTPFWDDASVDWRRFDVAVLRSTWDYVDRIDEFLAWADA